MNDWLNNLNYTGRGSTGLWLILKALNKPDTSVLLPANICETVPMAVLAADMNVCFYDVDPLHGNADLKHIQSAQNPDTTVLVAVHNFGRPLEIPVIADWAKRKNIFLIEDVCNALMAHYRQDPLGSFGDAAIFSFGYSKIIEVETGGAFIVKDHQLKKEALKLLDQQPSYCQELKLKYQSFQDSLTKFRETTTSAGPGTPVNMFKFFADSLLYQIPQSLIPLIKEEIRTLNSNLERRKEFALRYRSRIQSASIQHCPVVPGEIFWRFTALAKSSSIRNSLIKKIRNNNLLVSAWYPPINHYFLEDQKADSFQGAFDFGQRVFNLFVDKRVNLETVDRTIGLVNSIE
jgi:dTDP-4-amino-4,6-dideoxygalactose transaminase